MSQPAIAASTPTSFLRRAMTWWLAQVEHALPPLMSIALAANVSVFFLRRVRASWPGCRGQEPWP